MYRVIVPANNWKNPIPANASELTKIVKIAQRLGLKMTDDKKQQKLYLDLPDSSKDTQKVTGLVEVLGDLSLDQIAALKSILLEADERELTPSETAYIIATVYHESRLGKFMLELSDGRQYEGRPDLGNKHPGDGARYKGRGYVQITGRANYRKFSTVVGVDLEKYPDLAVRPEHALKILFEGMTKGMFTGVSLDDFTQTSGKLDFFQARRVVNGLDRAKEIAQLAEELEAKLKEE